MSPISRPIGSALCSYLTHHRNMMKLSALAGQIQTRIYSTSMLEGYHAREEAQTGNRAIHYGEGRERSILIVMKRGLSLCMCSLISGWGFLSTQIKTSR